MALPDVIIALVSCLSGQCLNMGRVNLQIECMPLKLLEQPMETPKHVHRTHAASIV